MRRIVDLTLPVHEGMSTYPASWHPEVKITRLAAHGVEGRRTHELVLGTHTGTHVDAPCHFIRGGSGLDAIPIKWFAGPALVVSVPIGGIDEPMLRTLLDWRRPSRLVLRSGWDTQVDSPDYYTAGPWLTLAAARFLVEDRGIGLLALDFPSPERPGDEASPVHKYLLGRGIVLVEYLCGLDQLRTDRFELVVLPLRLTGDIDGAPCRVVAIEEE